MKLTIDRLHLLAAITTVQAFADGEHGILTTEDGNHSLTAGGKDGGASYALTGVEVATPGECVIPLALLRSWLVDSAAERVQLTTNPHAVIVHGTDTERLSFAATDPLAIPTATPPDDATAIVINTPEFRRAVSRVVFAASKPAHAGKWATRAICIDVAGGTLTLAATDEVRLATVTVSIPDNTAAVSRLLIPATAVRQWSKVRIPSESVTLTLWDNGATFAAGPLTAWTHLLVGKFPVLPPTDRPNAATIPLPELARALRMALAGADPEPEDEVDPLIRYVSLRLEAGSLTVKGEAPDGLSSAVDVALPGYSGARFATTLDGQRLSQYLKVVAGEGSVVMRWEGVGGKPVEFTAGAESRYLTTVRSEQGRQVA